mgnify:CR=1 FL=1
MFKSLYKETEGFRLVSILTPLCMIGEVVMEMIIPKLMSSIIDDGVTAGNLSHIYRIGGWMIVAAAFGLLFGVLAGIFLLREPRYPVKLCGIGMVILGLVLVSLL